MRKMWWPLMMMWLGASGVFAQQTAPQGSGQAPATPASNNVQLTHGRCRTLVSGFGRLTKPSGGLNTIVLGSLQQQFGEGKGRSHMTPAGSAPCRLR